MHEKTDEELIAEFVAAGRVKRYPLGATGAWEAIKRERAQKRQAKNRKQRIIAVAVANSDRRRSATKLGVPEKADDGS